MSKLTKKEKEFLTKAAERIIANEKRIKEALEKN